MQSLGDLPPLPFSSPPGTRDPVGSPPGRLLPDASRLTHAFLIVDYFLSLVLPHWGFSYGQDSMQDDPWVDFHFSLTTSHVHLCSLTVPSLQPWGSTQAARRKRMASLRDGRVTTSPTSSPGCMACSPKVTRAGDPGLFSSQNMCPRGSNPCKQWDASPLPRVAA